MEVRTRIKLGKTERDKVIGYVIKKDDVKLAYVTFPKEVKFTFPDLFPTDAETKKQRKEDERSLDSSKEQFKRYLDQNKKRRGMPGWYSI